MSSCKRTFVKITLGSILLFGTGSGALAQNQPATNKKPGIAVRSEVVLVPAIVTNHAGAHVTDLTQDNFRILENGQLQKIAFFHHIQGPREPAAPQALAPGNVVSNTPAAGAQSSAILV